LLGRPLLAHIVAVRAGHSLHSQLVRQILASPECWEQVGYPEPQEAVAAVTSAKTPVTEPAS